MSETPLGAILTGGRSSRMGTDKADVVVAGETMLDRVAKAVQAASDRVILLGSDRPGWECWPDSVHAEGPLAGIVTALNRMSSSRVLVVAVDQPFVDPETLRRLVAIDSELPVVPVDDEGVRQVTCAVYPRAVTHAANEEANLGGSIQMLLDRVSFDPVTPDVWRAWGEDGRSWFGVDTPEALADGMARFPG
ncbi:MAG TPA: molybdenum cofactor guanylyltransferase [Acidimicrobiia bacterium]|nr:molybdenum cofactor guanylyltransferase [Acidimicrobiia bacterium]